MTFQTRNVRGAKLTGEQVYELREKYAQGATQGSLAQEYNMSVGQIARIVRGEAWRGRAHPSPPAPKLSEAELAAIAQRIYAAQPKKD